MRAHNREVAAVRAELEALPKFASGEAAGVLEIGRGWLGDPWTVPPREDPFDPDADDPFLRFEREMGRDPR